MLTFETFVAGLTRIGVATRQAPEPATFEVYYLGIRSRTDAAEWDRFTRAAIDPCRWQWFPKLGELQDALREFQGARPLLAEATEAYERTLACREYSPQGGGVWTFRGVREACGEAAAEAFMAAGGHAAFATTWNEDRRRERFVAAYVEAVREEPSAALPAPSSRPALPAAGREPTADEAKAIIAQLAAGIGRPMPREPEKAEECGG